MDLQMVDTKKHGLSILVSTLFVLVILFESSLSRDVIDAAQSNMGKVAMALILIAIFASIHPITGVLAILAFWKISVDDSHVKNVRFEDDNSKTTGVPSTGADDMLQYNNTDAVVSGDIGGTLEEEVISKMAPLKSVGEPSTETYAPVLDTSINSSNVGEV